MDGSQLILSPKTAGRYRKSLPMFVTTLVGSSSRKPFNLHFGELCRGDLEVRGILGSSLVFTCKKQQAFLSATPKKEQNSS